MAKKEQALPSNQFEHEGNIYEVILPKINIPELGIRTALEVCVDKAAQDYLVNNGCIGSVIREVV